MSDNWEAYWDDRAKRNALYYIHSACKDWNEKDFFKTGEEEINILKQFKYFKDIRLDNAFDFGCGVGRVAFALAKIFKKVVGSDISQVMIDKANDYKEKFKINNIEFKKCNGKDLKDIKDKSFSFVFSTIVLQHVENPLREDLKKELFRITKKGGWVFMQDLCPIQWEIGFRKWLINEVGFTFVDIIRENSGSVYIWGRK